MNEIQSADDFALRKRYLINFNVYVRLPAQFACALSVFFGVSKRVRKLTFKIVCSKTVFLEQKSVLLDFEVHHLLEILI